MGTPLVVSGSLAALRVFAGGQVAVLKYHLLFHCSLRCLLRKGDIRWGKPCNFAPISYVWDVMTSFNATFLIFDVYVQTDRVL